VAGDCVFCRIAAGTIPARIVHRDRDILAIVDADPKAPHHLLVLPVSHIPDFPALLQAPAILVRLFTVAGELGKAQGAGGFRAVVNTGSDGGQTVEHVHVHVLAGRPMTWPPG